MQCTETWLKGERHVLRSVVNISRGYRRMFTVFNSYVVFYFYLFVWGPLSYVGSYHAQFNTTNLTCIFCFSLLGHSYYFIFLGLSLYGISIEVQLCYSIVVQKFVIFWHGKYLSTGVQVIVSEVISFTVEVLCIRSVTSSIILSWHTW